MQHSSISFERKHMRFCKFIHPMVVSDASLRPSLSKSQKTKSKKAPFSLSYEKGELEKKFKASKATALTKATLQKYTKKKTTLPEDLHMEADRHFKLFLRQSIMVGCSSFLTCGYVMFGLKRSNNFYAHL
jgi:hypothetical protein